jgi:hypothetical protein
VKNIFKKTKLKKLHILVRWQLVMYGRPAGPGFVSGYVGFASSTRMFFFYHHWNQRYRCGIGGASFQRLHSRECGLSFKEPDRQAMINKKGVFQLTTCWPHRTARVEASQVPGCGRTQELVKGWVRLLGRRLLSR